MPDMEEEDMHFGKPASEPDWTQIRGHTLDALLCGWEVAFFGISPGERDGAWSQG